MVNFLFMISVFPIGSSNFKQGPNPATLTHTSHQFIHCEVVKDVDIVWQTVPTWCHFPVNGMIWGRKVLILLLKRGGVISPYLHTNPSKNVSGTMNCAAKNDIIYDFMMMSCTHIPPLFFMPTQGRNNKGFLRHYSTFHDMMARTTIKQTLDHTIPGSFGRHLQSNFSPRNSSDGLYRARNWLVSTLSQFPNSYIKVTLTNCWTSLQA